MILAIDVQYDDDSALVAGVLFDKWPDAEPRRCLTKRVHDIKPYEPGNFYKRELPCIVSLLTEISECLEVIIVDGFVTLGQEPRKGLGMHLFDTLNGKTAVVGVAKKAFKDTPEICEVLRGKSSKPLYITAVGIDLEEAITAVSSMHGKHRTPTLLKMADQLCRGIQK